METAITKIKLDIENLDKAIKFFQIEGTINDWLSIPFCTFGEMIINERTQKEIELYKLTNGRSPDTDILVTFLDRGVDNKVMLHTAKETFKRVIEMFGVDRVNKGFPDDFLDQRQNKKGTDCISLGPNCYLKTDFGNEEKRRKIKNIAQKFNERVSVILTVKGTKTNIN
jgi:hypothetical protein